jgi:carbon monoxide dehydrogenase subunit G
MTTGTLKQDGQNKIVMAKKVGRPKKVQVNIEGDKTDVIIKTNKAEVEYHKDGINQELNYDGKKVDVNIKKDETGTKVTIESENKFLKAIATLASKFVVKRFKK